MAGHQDIHWKPVYWATKHAVQSCVHTVRQQTASTGVRIGAIAPGIVLHPLWGFEHGSAEEQERIDTATGIRSPDVVVRHLVLLSTGQDI